MKEFCKELREHSTKIINYEKKNMISLTTEEKIRDNCLYTGTYRGAAHNICNLRYKIPKEIPVVFITALLMIIIS